MKRASVLKRIKDQSRDAGLAFFVREGTRHTLVTVGNTTRTLGRHKEVPDGTARAFFEQFANELGKGWWR